MEPVIPVDHKELTILANLWKRRTLKYIASQVLFVTQEKSFDFGSADPRGNPMAVNLWLEICQLKRIC
jgi:hypothetical protein